MSRSGSKGTGLDTTHRRQESVDVPNLGEAFFGRETEDARNVLQHVGIPCQAGGELAVQRKSGGGNEAIQGSPAWITQPPFDPGNHRLHRSGAPGQLSLAQLRPFPCLSEKARSILIHPFMIAD